MKDGEGGLLKCEASSLLLRRAFGSPHGSGEEKAGSAIAQVGA